VQTPHCTAKPGSRGLREERLCTDGRKVCEVLPEFSDYMEPDLKKEPLLMIKSEEAEKAAGCKTLS
jgi:hypothetical protein